MDIASTLKVNVVAYDYSGYGQSSGEPSEENLYKDSEAISSFMKDFLDISEKKTVLFGWSLGSVPIVDLASRKEYKNVIGTILLSPVASGSRLIYDFKEKKDFENEHFCNLKKVKEVTSYVFVIHGKKDEIIKCKSVEDMTEVTEREHERAAGCRGDKTFGHGQ